MGTPAVHCNLHAALRFVLSNTDLACVVAGDDVDGPASEEVGNVSSSRVRYYVLVVPKVHAAMVKL